MLVNMYTQVGRSFVSLSVTEYGGPLMGILDMYA
jgi:hypothetical protein